MNAKIVLQEIAALAAAGAHVNVVRYYFAWMEEHENGVHFYVQMERCGTSLAQRANVDVEPFKEAELLDLLRQACLTPKVCFKHLPCLMFW